jgi:hypothetical protein
MQKRMKQERVKQELKESTFLRVVGMDDERFTRKVQYLIISNTGGIGNTCVTMRREQG